jgi:hypothetical protein
VRELPWPNRGTDFFKIFTKIVFYGVIGVGNYEYHIRFERNLKLREIKPDKRGLRGIKGKNDRIKAGKGAEGHPLSPEGAKMEIAGLGVRGI